MIINTYVCGYVCTYIYVYIYIYIYKGQAALPGARHSVLRRGMITNVDITNYIMLIRLIGKTNDNTNREGGRCERGSSNLEREPAASDVHVVPSRSSLPIWVFTTGGCSGRGVQWMGVVS